MSESPIELRGKGGGVVFQGTQSPGGGSMPATGVNILRIPQTITGAEVAAAWDSGAALIPLTEYVPAEDDTVLWVRLRRPLPFSGGPQDFSLAIDTVGGVGGVDMPTWGLSAPSDALASGWWAGAGNEISNPYHFAYQDAAANPVGLVAVIFSGSSGDPPEAGECVLEFLVARAP